MRVLVCGGRAFDDYDFVRRTLDPLFLHTKDGCFVVIQGGATGADRLAREWSVNRGCSYWNYPADWKAHGKAAGPLRNQRMLDDGKPDLVIAFPGGRGTADMIRRAKAAGVEVRELGSSLVA